MNTQDKNKLYEHIIMENVNFFAMIWIKLVTRINLVIRSLGINLN